MKLRVESPVIPGASKTVMELDGVDYAKVVRGLSLSIKPGDVPDVTLDVLLTDGLSFEGDVSRIEVPDQSAELLKHAGWLPPVNSLGVLLPDVRERLVALRQEYADLAAGRPTAMARLRS